MARNVKHIMRGDLDIATAQILDRISSVALLGPSLRGPCLRLELAKKGLLTIWIGKGLPSNEKYIP